MKNPIWKILLIVVLVVSCDFQPTGTNYVEIDPYFEPADITIKLPAETDTIFHSSAYDFSFHYDLRGEIEKLNYVFLYIDTTLVGQSKGEAGTISTKHYVLRKDSIFNYHTVTLVAALRSGTGSIADIMGAEGTVYQRTWVLCVYDRDSFVPGDIRLENENGRMKLSWDKYPFSDFENYLVYKTINFSHPYEMRLAIITDANQTSIYDDSYVGENAKYRIIYTSERGNDLHTNEAEIESSISDINYEVTGDYSVRMHWKKCQYPYAFQQYETTMTIDYDKDKEAFTDISRTTKDYTNIPIGKKSTFFFYIKPKTTPNNYPIVQGRNYFFKNVFIGEEWQGFDQLIFVGDRYAYFTHSRYNNTYVYLFDTKEGKIKDSISVAGSYDNILTKSPDGRHILIKYKKKVTLLSAGELRNGTDFTEQEICGSTSVFEFFNHSIADNLIGGIVNVGYLYLYDFKNKKLLDSIKVRTNNLLQRISSDGRHIVLFDNSRLVLYRYENSTLDSISSFNSNSMAYFIPGTSELICFDEDNGNTYKILDCNTNSFIKNLNISYPIISCDFASSQALLRYTDRIAVVDLTGSNQVIKEYNAKSVSYQSVLNEGHIYFQTGIKMKVDK